MDQLEHIAMHLEYPSKIESLRISTECGKCETYTQ